VEVETTAAAKAPEAEETPDVEDMASAEEAPGVVDEKAADEKDGGAGDSSVTSEEDNHGDKVPVAEADAEPVSESAEPAPDETEAEQPAVRILSGTKRYHRPTCALIEDIGEDADDLESLSRSAAKDRGCTPCLVCQPDKEPDTTD